MQNGVRIAPLLAPQKRHKTTKPAIVAGFIVL